MAKRVAVASGAVAARISAMNISVSQIDGMKLHEEILYLCQGRVEKTLRCPRIEHDRRRRVNRQDYNECIGQAERVPVPAAVRAFKHAALCSGIKSCRRGRVNRQGIDFSAAILTPAVLIGVHFRMEGGTVAFTGNIKSCPAKAANFRLGFDLLGTFRAFLGLFGYIILSF